MSVPSIPNELFLRLSLPVAPADLAYVEDEREGCVSTVTRLIRKGQDSNVLLSDSKSHALPIYFSVLPMEGAQYLSAVYNAAADIPELMVFFLLTLEPFNSLLLWYFLCLIT